MTASVDQEVITAVQVGQFDAAILERVFSDCFDERYNTRLEGGAAEPLYRPAGKPGDQHVIYYREDYFASALHEISHWCIAGPQRRLLEDFGYWYAPDGRSEAQQQAFERVECKPQALELLFSRACGYGFSVSADNLDGDREPDTSAFQQAIFDQARKWQREGLPDRAAEFLRALSTAFGTDATLAEFELPASDHTS